jgi:hypothetical protein
MKRFLLALALLLAPSLASAQCNGVFPDNTVCGNVGAGTARTPRPTNPSAFLGAAGGSNGQIQYNNNGALGGLTDAAVTARIALFTALLSGAAPASGGGTTNYLRADATWTNPIGTVFSATRTVLKAIDTTLITQSILTESGREGTFVFTAGNYTTAIAADTNEGVYIKADAIAASAGAWVRQFDFTNFQTQWFGAVADYSTDNTTLINSMIAVANIQNTSVVNGRQTSVYINIQGGVKFASQNIQWLPTAGWIFTYLRYFANSDTTIGIATGGGGTNEQHILSVNSGYPQDVTGGLVSEQIWSAPLHPASGVNVQKNIDNSIYVHSGPTQSAQPNAVNNAVTATVAYIRDENFDRFRIAYTRFAANDYFNNVALTFNNRSTELLCSGCNGAGAWGASIPAAGDVVRGVTTLSRYVVTSMAAADIIKGDWVSGTAVPGEFLMRERAIFKGSISGTTLTVTSMLQGDGNIAVGHRIAGMYANNGITAATNITALGTGTGGIGTYTVNNSQTIAETQMIAGNVAANSIIGAGVVDTDTQYTPAFINIKGHFALFRQAFAALATCTTITEGSIATVTDSNTATWGATVAAGGANRILAYCNGTNWTVMGK